MRWGPQARYSHGFHHPELPNEPDDGFHRPTESTMPMRIFGVSLHWGLKKRTDFVAPPKKNEYKVGFGARSSPNGVKGAPRDGP